MQLHQVGQSSMEQPVQKSNSFLTLVLMILSINFFAVVLFYAICSWAGVL